ncbi:MAG: hypothetical protein MJ124_01360 [Lachnospiraceae bacterium]|nr:hypothetical protein [Lachnospiraceae bacterium]
MISDNNGGLPRYCHPFHGDWDVARIALDIPESKVLFVCPASCARIIKLNSFLSGYADRIYVLGLTEADIVAGDYEKKTYEAACEIIETEEIKPKALIIYVSCIDAMLGNDHSFQTKKVMEKHPDVNCFVLKMCPITRYSTDLPLVELQNDMYSALPLEKVEKTRTVAFIGANIAPGEDNEIVKLLKANNYRVLHIQASDKYEDYLDIRSSVLNIAVMPFARKACETLKKRYGTEYMPVLLRPDPDYIDGVIKELCSRLDIECPDVAGLREEALNELRSAAKAVEGYEIIIDSTANMFPLVLKEVLKNTGFNVKMIYRDSADTAAPDIDSGHITMPGKRLFVEQPGTLAIGEVANCFSATEKGIKLFYDNGYMGYAALKKLAQLIKEGGKE